MLDTESQEKEQDKDEKISNRRKTSKSILAVKDMSQEEQRLHRNAEILRMMPDNIADALAKSRTKPVWCSDIRWRMELRRRSSARYSF